MSLNLRVCLLAFVVYSLRGEDPGSSVATEATLASCPVNLMKFPGHGVGVI